ncbi:hypothetical protein QBC47DRAFT_354197 [Echria macrotheca]|uniref:Uncharacterized protein n=1 Tax=Echria macrotheca TaxID=438768 RepID=A0AAJ0B4F0_9PEZI|nr:hypothetical protein QBC47DRAFT_354197 [Echria macrotheca]
MHGDMSSMKPSNRKSHETTGTTTNTSSTSRPRTPRSLAISLTPREQALLYCELEYTISNALNAYLTTEFTAGRLSPSKLKRIADQWQSRGRPKVTGFRYDIETQLDLVRLHVHDFKFYSSPTHSAITSSVVGILDMMTADARALRIRTYCQPDTVIAKQVLDAQNLFNVLGCEDGLQMALAEITGFLRAGIERERHHSAARDRLLSGGGGGVGRDSLRHAKSHSGERGGMGSSSSAGRDLRRVSSFGFAGKGDAGGGFVKEEEDDVF